MVAAIFVRRRARPAASPRSTELMEEIRETPAEELRSASRLSVDGIAQRLG
jgi:hypothetical protein